MNFDILKGIVQFSSSSQIFGKDDGLNSNYSKKNSVLTMDQGNGRNPKFNFSNLLLSINIMSDGCIIPSEESRRKVESLVKDLALFFNPSTIRRNRGVLVEKMNLAVNMITSSARAKKNQYSRCNLLLWCFKKFVKSGLYDSILQNLLLHKDDILEEEVTYSYQILLYFITSYRIVKFIYNDEQLHRKTMDFIRNLSRSKIGKKKPLKYFLKVFSSCMSLMQNMAVDSSMKCQFCHVKKGSKICSSCRDSYYCSFECQKEDWSVHRQNCVKTKFRRRDMTSKKQLSFAHQLDGKLEGDEKMKFGRYIVNKGDFKRPGIVWSFYSPRGPVILESEKNVDILVKEIEQIFGYDIFRSQLTINEMGSNEKILSQSEFSGKLKDMMETISENFKKNPDLPNKAKRYWILFYYYMEGTLRITVSVLRYTD